MFFQELSCVCIACPNKFCYFWFGWTTVDSFHLFVLYYVVFKNRKRERERERERERRGGVVVENLFFFYFSQRLAQNVCTETEIAWGAVYCWGAIPIKLLHHWANFGYTQSYLVKIQFSSKFFVLYDIHIWIQLETIYKNK